VAADEDDDEDSGNSDSDSDDGEAAVPAAKRGKAAAAAAAAKPVATERLPPQSLGFKQRQLVLFGLPADYDKKRLWKRVRKTAGAVELAWPVAVPGNFGLLAAYVTYDRKVGVEF
jgi:hypothetical protein